MQPRSVLTALTSLTCVPAAHVREVRAVHRLWESLWKNSQSLWAAFLLLLHRNEQWDWEMFIYFCTSTWFIVRVIPEGINIAQIFMAVLRASSFIYICENVLWLQFRCEALPVVFPLQEYKWQCNKQDIGALKMQSRTRSTEKSVSLPLTD